VKLSVIMPVFNEEQTIGEVIERVFAVDDARRQLVSDARRERPLRRPPHGHGNRVQGVALAGRRIREVPIGYQPRRKEEGKKTGGSTGWTLCTCSFGAGSKGKIRFGYAIGVGRGIREAVEDLCVRV
jgi:hypothetical protein